MPEKMNFRLGVDQNLLFNALFIGGEHRIASYLGVNPGF